MNPKIVRMLYLFTVLHDRPDLGVRAGEMIAYDPRDPDGAFSVTRRFAPDPGAVLAAFMAGDLGGEIPPQLVQEAERQPSASPLTSRPALRLLRAHSEPRSA